VFKVCIGIGMFVFWVIGDSCSLFPASWCTMFSFFVLACHVAVECVGILFH